MTGLALDFQFRDFPNEYLPMIEEQWLAIEQRGCYVPRYYHAPASNQQTLTAANPYLRYTLEIPAGSFILGLKHNLATGFVLKITDIGLNHSFFSDPVPDSYLLAGATPTVNPGQNGYYFPKPYPVISPGRFICEFFNTLQEDVNAEIVFQVAEVLTHVEPKVPANAH